ncbi:metallophosphoesterase [Rummeliibacillus sp. NPDC094406]|uniref:metallophosphoesterase n=1 Tax=Rummeliibacillus sp. NPDC094406 TaxID=3364511 RepID=UPI00380AC4A1
MKILVMSDTHSDAAVITRVMEQNPSVDAIFHCGDSELPFTASELQGIYKVRGNCDHDVNFPTEVVEEIDGKRIFMTHGHLFNVKSNLTALSYRAREVQADVVLFGHSHVLGVELVDGILYVNPGSLLLPRGRKEKSYAIIENIENGWHIIFYTEEKNVIAEKTLLY